MRGNVEGRDISPAVADIEKGLASLKLPARYFISYGGLCHFDAAGLPTALRRFVVRNYY